MGEHSGTEAPAPPGMGLRPRVALAALAAWAIPGAGHWILGRRARGLAFAGIVFSSLALGVWLDGNLHRMLVGEPLTVLWTLGSMGVGLPYFVLRFLAGYEGSVLARGFEYGSAFILTAGLMNLLLVLDSLDLARGRKA